MRSDYVKLLQRRALLESQLLEAREDTLRAKFVPAITSHLLKFMSPEAGDRPEGWRFVERDMSATKHLHRDKFTDSMMRTRYMPPEDGFDFPLYCADIAAAMVEDIMAADPDRTKSFSTWMLNIYLKGNLRIEDLPRATDALAMFGDLVQRKRLPAEARDINRYPDVQTVQQVIKPFQQEAVTAQNAAYEAQMLAQSTVWLNTDRVLMLTPNSLESAQWFGRDTEWCTAWGSKLGRHPTRGSMYSSYATKSPLYIVRDKTDETKRFQLHFSTQQYMDVNDRRLNIEAFLGEYPEVNKGFDNVIAKWNTDNGSGKSMFKIIETRTRTGLELKLTQANFDGLSGFAGVAALSAMTGHRISGDREGQEGNFVSGYRLTGVQFQPFHLRDNPRLQDELIRILNQYQFRGDHETAMMLGIAWDEARRKYVDESKKGTITLDKKATKWKKFNLDENLRYVLYDAADNEVLTVHINKHEYSYNQPDYFEARVEGDHKFTKEDGVEIYKMLRAISNRRNIRLDADSDFFEIMSREHALEIAKIRPDWLTFFDRFRLFGDTTATRRRLVSTLQETMGTDQRFAWVGDRLIVLEWDDLDEFVDDYGNEYAENLNKYVSGEEHLDLYDTYMDDSDRQEMLESLTAEDKVKLVNYFKTNEAYLEFIEEEEIYFTDPVKDILACYDYEEDDNLKRAFESGMNASHESGMVSEMSKALQRSVEDQDNIWFLRDGKLVEKFDWNTKIVLAISMADLCKELASPDKLDELANEGWATIFFNDNNPKFGPNHDGDYHGYDDEARNERFGEDIDEFVL